MMNFQKESSVAYYQKYADAYNMSLEDFMTYYLGIKNTDELWESIKDESETYAKHYLIYQAAAEQLEYKVTEDEIKTYFLKMKGTEDYSSTKEQTGLPYIKFMVMCENIIKTLTSGAKLAK